MARSDLGRKPQPCLPTQRAEGINDCTHVTYSGHISMLLLEALTLLLSLPFE